MAQTLWKRVNGEGATEWVGASADYPLPVEVLAGGSSSDSVLALTSASYSSAGAHNFASGAKSAQVFIESGTATIDGVEYTGPGTWAAEAPDGYVLPAITMTVGSTSVVKTTELRPA